ncbi:MAG: hypothetical protein JO249_08825 [Acidobacteria bacterium]|nr:hypothetical protein [Acidobacteriota bacterium]
MRRESKLRVVHDPGKGAEPISSLSSDEQTHLLDLADVALQNKKPEKPVAGNRARKEHERLKRELKEAVERSGSLGNDAA